jgi:RNA polymerase sigma-70 factor (ECF subfamily)
MPERDAFADFLRRIRAGDERAAAELVSRYGPFLRREVRLRLTDPGLSRQLDSEDVCQSVLASFFARAALGQYDLSDARQLVGLLLSMARHKLAHAARKHRAQRRDVGRVAGTAVTHTARRIPL